MVSKQKKDIAIAKKNGSAQSVNDGSTLATDMLGHTYRITSHISEDKSRDVRLDHVYLLCSGVHF